MRPTIRVSIAVVLLCVSISALGQADRLIPMSPCRLLDTRFMPPASAAEQGARTIDIAPTRCGTIIPGLATAYAIRVTRYDATGEGTVKRSSFPSDVSRFPAGTPASFPVPPNANISVDVEGFYVRPGTPIDLPPLPARPSSVVSPTSTSTSAASPSQKRLVPGAQTIADGSTGTIYLNGLNGSWTSVGVLGWATSASPWIVDILGDAQGGSAYELLNSAGTQLIAIQSNGATRLINGWDFLSARSDYIESSTITNNNVDRIDILNPRDSSGGATSRVTYFNATSEDESGSPSTTKFYAATLGYANHPDINFDSQIGYSWPGSSEYYYRAYSAREGRETFWIKANTSGDSITNTRADMYVSGNVGIGTTSPLAVLDVRNSDGYFYAGFGYGSTRDTYLRAGNASLGIMHIGDHNTVNTLIQEFGGNVGIGTTTPGQRLSVAGVVESTSGGFKFPDGTTQTSAFAPSTGGVLSLNAASPQYTLTSTNSAQKDVLSTSGAGLFIDVTGHATPSNNIVVFRTTNVASSFTPVEAMRITSNGNVEIGGQASDSVRLNVNGNANIAGTLTANAVVNAVFGQDVAEWVRGDRELAAGTVVVVNPEKTNEVMPSSAAYDTTVAGVVSAQPGVILGRPGALKATVATSGRVRVRVDARKGAIRVGDLLVTSDEPGTAMKSQPIEVGGRKFHQPGTILGKALEPLPDGVGEILVLLCLG
jgi:hypothetical protein